MMRVLLIVGLTYLNRYGPSSFDWQVPFRGHPATILDKIEVVRLSSVATWRFSSSLQVTDTVQGVPESPEVPPELPQVLTALLVVAASWSETAAHVLWLPEALSHVPLQLEVGVWLPAVAVGQPGAVVEPVGMR